MEFRLLIIGTDINAYTVARAYHEKYGKKADLIGKIPMEFTSTSKICNITYEKDILNNDVFLDILKKYSDKYIKEKIILVGTNDHYVDLIVRNKDVLSDNFLFNYPTYEIVNTFLDKSLFYKKYNKYFDMPKTIIYSCNKKKLNIKGMLYPIIIKPADGHLYHSIDFKGQNKVFKVENEQELIEIISLIENAGYDKDLLLQEFIPGDDSMLFDSMFYVSSKNKAQYATFAQIALQEHTDTGIGNCTVLLNGYSQFGEYDKLVNKAKKFLEEINYSGFAEFDFKYDIRDGKYKLFEINPRQARCCYYFSCCANNLVECLVDDLLLEKNKKFELSKKRLVLSFVPRKIVYKHIHNRLLLTEIKNVIKVGDIVSSLDYKLDNSFKRKVYLLLRSKNYNKKYNRSNWWY